MKRLRKGIVNTLSFVKLNSFTANNFTIALTKVVGTEELVLSGLTDNHGLNNCKDFITLNVDLLTNTLEDGGEYVLTLTNGSNSYEYLALVDSYTTTTGSGSVYGNTVKFSDL
jgi:hypothetical protein